MTLQLLKDQLFEEFLESFWPLIVFRQGQINQGTLTEVETGSVRLTSSLW
jgi:hypothetical protein